MIKNNTMSCSFSLPFGLMLLSLSSLLLVACQSDSDPHAAQFDCSSAELAEKMKEAKGTPWQQSALSKKGLFRIDLSCQQAPFVGDFQSCQLKLYQKNQAVVAQRISMEGGMKAHGHGLPTMPRIRTTEETGHYRIEGLKYSMPGAWTIGFQVSLDQATDFVIFDFVI